MSLNGAEWVNGAPTILYASNQKQPPQVFCQISVLKDFEKLASKHLCQSLFLIKLSALPAMLLKKGFCHRCFPGNLVNFLRIPSFKKHLGQLLPSNQDIFVQGSIQNSYLSVLFTTIFLNLLFRTGIKENFQVVL